MPEPTWCNQLDGARPILRRALFYAAQGVQSLLNVRVRRAGGVRPAVHGFPREHHAGDRRRSAGVERARTHLVRVRSGGRLWPVRPGAGPGTDGRGEEVCLAGACIDIWVLFRWRGQSWGESSEEAGMRIKRFIPLPKARNKPRLKPPMPAIPRPKRVGTKRGKRRPRPMGFDPARLPGQRGRR